MVFEHRLLRTILAALVGASLAASDCAMQAFFRNPLADPYILGVSSGASVGAALAISLGFVL
ncbi:MAG: iron chelate uptake ABC transporter family permease subunit [Archaeoglobaceae archaeon]|nr:iron chelate uptake ABC transporter family permease subunit [Archaeoglobaceae archaeon]MCX8152430.1 iron chelate uptake ABC transporter family permease subunit [Archaeoglobaceae archaeon]MDW8013770.1 iron chelate uptake ABC transporter family permease subunit [Archaeoglobaceae archaeon]